MLIKNAHESFWNINSTPKYNLIYYLINIDVHHILEIDLTHYIIG